MPETADCDHRRRNSSSVRKNTTLDLSAVKVTTLDQFGKAFTPEELAAYPASVRWTLEKNDTHAVISGNTLSFGDQEGTMTLICAAVNADTNVIVEKKISFASQTPPPAAARPAAAVVVEEEEASPNPAIRYL